jgi:hypothetical protein
MLQEQTGGSTGVAWHPASLSRPTARNENRLMPDPASQNLDELPQGDLVTRRERLRQHQREREPLEGLGCLLFIVSSTVLLGALDFLANEARRLRLSHEAEVAFWCLPLFCLIAWLAIFHLPIGKRLPIAWLRALRRAPALVRHGVLWTALMLLCLLCQIVLPLGR